MRDSAVGILLERGIDLQHHLVLGARGVDRVDLALAERIVERLVDLGERQAELGGRIAVDVDGDVRRGDLLVGGDVLQLGQLGHRLLDDRRPVVELVGIGRGEGVLELGLAEPAADIDVLAGLHEVAHARHLGHLGPQALDHLLRRIAGTLVERLQLDEHAGGVLGRVAAGRADEADHAGDGGILLDDVGQPVLELGHGVEGNVLARLGLAEDEAGVLLGEEALGNRRRRGSRSGRPARWSTSG